YRLLLLSQCSAAPPTAIYPLSLHDALPICRPPAVRPAPPGGRSSAPRPAPRWCPDRRRRGGGRSRRRSCAPRRPGSGSAPGSPRSEEHTSELQSRENLVCRLLLEKKKDNRQ